MPRSKAELAVVLEARPRDGATFKLHGIAAFDWVYEECFDFAGRSSICMSIGLPSSSLLLAEIPVAKFAEWAAPGRTAAKMLRLAVVGDYAPEDEPYLPIQERHSNDDADHQRRVDVVFIWHIDAFIFGAEYFAGGFARCRTRHLVVRRKAQVKE
jgi:hypothetical protein